MSGFEIEFYTLPDGTQPVRELIDSLDAKLSRKVLDDLDMLRHYGNRLREPYSKRVSDGVFELRIRQSSNSVRVLYFFVAGRRIVVTHGFVKKSNKLPRAELRRAKRYRQDWLERNR
ncbi:type II toxin-antitoxin system RelE/ParE family toxin [Bifidobacterium sp. ESL0790]|uniref:type II toxin-antitoxin system RelE/ParE family toxin n=1 Tax=Bifidobacterium sp. ESL0790 TaxID=2983233 RepID=UPI0023F90664|nr:type II toxin-antitoxin system RelE/ParE family toxin [Bifidobacterium sp. ESL0790]WEV72585.1 type II toxin-antitoxin system RelE/ParE family toxin [Bifidobacterium sp. ESL0790]